MSTPTRTPLVVALTALLLLLLQSSLTGAKCGPTIDERDVVVLDKGNFSDFLSKNRYVWVNFYAPWCYWSRKLEPEFAAAATMLKGEVALAKVNCALEEELKEKNKINGYPSLVFFINGVKVDNYYRNRTRDVLASYARRMVQMSNHTVRTTEEAKSLMDAKTTAVLGFLPCLKGKAAEEFAAASQLQSDVKFYQFVSPNVAETFHINPFIKRPAVVMMKEGNQFTLRVGAYNSSEIAKFVFMETTRALPAAEVVVAKNLPGLKEQEINRENVFEMIMERIAKLAESFKRDIEVDFM